MYICVQYCITDTSESQSFLVWRDFLFDVWYFVGSHFLLEFFSFFFIFFFITPFQGPMASGLEKKEMRSGSGCDFHTSLLDRTVQVTSWNIWFQIHHRRQQLQAAAQELVISLLEWVLKVCADGNHHICVCPCVCVCVTARPASSLICCDSAAGHRFVWIQTCFRGSQLWAASCQLLVPVSTHDKIKKKKLNKTKTHDGEVRLTVWGVNKSTRKRLMSGF